MKSFILIAFIVSLSLSAQEKVSPSFTLEGKLTKVVTYHENGEIAQTGFLKKNKLHGKWASFSETGEKIAMGSYLLGKKNGQWFFWKEDNLIEVVFENNVVLDKVEWGNKNKIVLNEL
tara:strand:+ start:1364 stop:1717 length:354 start_codon:yes stop_codon:yes gene_type:complete